MTANEKKTFVLDTNVILHDYRSIYNFTNNDIVIPIVVLEELDKFKKGNDLAANRCRRLCTNRRGWQAETASGSR